MPITPAFPGTPGLNSFVEELGTESPTKVQVDHSFGFNLGACWYNAKAQTRLMNDGDVAHGWAFWLVDAGILAQHHAVWRKSDGSLVDVTPNAEHSNEISFAHSPRHSFDYDSLKGWLSIRRSHDGRFQVLGPGNIVLSQPLGRTGLRPTPEELAAIRLLVPTAGQARYPL